MSLKILIADDDVDDLELIEEAIRGLAPDSIIDTVMSGRAAIDRLESYADGATPDLVILDYNMPEVNGAAVLSHLCSRERYKGMPRVMLSTSDASLHINECKTKGATEYFVKPITAHELNNIAKQMLALTAGR